MSNRRGPGAGSRGAGAARAELALVGRGEPARQPAAPVDRYADAYVALAPLRQALDGVEWAPLRLATTRPARPASPRLPHALALHLAHAARRPAGLTAPADAGSAHDLPAAVAPDRPRLAALLGTDAALLDGALDALVRAGVLEWATARGGEAPPAAGAVRLTPAVLGPPPRCAAVDWTALAAATAGSPSAWVAAHALAERLERHHWTPVPRADLEQTLGAGASGARGALERLVAAGVVERREQRGGVSVYRFADVAWGPDAGGVIGAAGSAAVGPLARAAERPAVVTPVAPAAPTVAPVALPAAGLRLVVGGVEVDVPAGMRARVEVGPDGRPTLTLLGAG